MKLKSTLGLAIGSVLAVSSLSVFAQGQGAVEAEAFAKHYFTDSVRDMENGNLFGGSVGYFLTDDVSLNLSYGEYHDMRSNDRESATRGRKNIKGSLSSLDAVYHFGTPGVGLRPYVSAGMGHQSISNLTPRTGRDHTTFANIGAGAKYYFTENVFAKASVDGMHGFDNHQSEWMAGVGVGVNFGGGGAPVAAPVEPAPAPVEPVVYEEVEAEPVRVELDVKFDFDKANVKQDSYSDIENLAEFMKQYPQTATTVEGHTDSIGNAAYNQKLSERRAGAVRDTLVNQFGVEASRINAVGYGKERPVADNATNEGRAINRRVEASVEAQAQ